MVYKLLDVQLAFLQFWGKLGQFNRQPIVFQLVTIRINEKKLSAAMIIPIVLVQVIVIHATHHIIIYYVELSLN